MRDLGGNDLTLGGDLLHPRTPEGTGAAVGIGARPHAMSYAIAASVARGLVQQKRASSSRC